MPLFSNNDDDSGSGSQRQRKKQPLQHIPPDEDLSGNEQAPPDEHTRLLPNRLDSNPLLRPDDPAVTPYNLWSVRVLRIVTIIFASLSFLWWALLLVSTFTTPPGLHTRGSGFYAFGYASLALANILFTVVFFGVPAKSVRIVAIINAVSPLIVHDFRQVQQVQ